MNNGGPAYPVQRMGYQPVTGRQVVRESWEGMNLRDYFAAHAPEPWFSYEPVFDEPEPQAAGGGSNRQGSFSDMWNVWARRRMRAYEEQWPYYYADVMIREREGGQDE